MNVFINRVFRNWEFKKLGIHKNHAAFNLYFVFQSLLTIDLQLFEIIDWLTVNRD